MEPVFLNIYSVYPESGDDQMFGTTIDEKWPKCVPASLRDQATIFIQRNLYWRQRSLLPVPPHIDSIIHRIQPQFKPLLHFHFIKK